MNVAQLHLMLTHFPIVGFIASFGLLLYALWRRKDEARNIALVGMLLSGIIVLPVMASGNASEDFVEGVQGVSHSMMVAHAHAADTAGTLAVLAGAAALLTLLLQRWRPNFAKAGMLGVLALSVVATISLGYTAHLGGEIRHPELALAWNAGGEGGEGAEGGLLSRLSGAGEGTAVAEPSEGGEKGSVSLIGRLTGREAGEGNENGEGREGGEAPQVQVDPPAKKSGKAAITRSHKGRRTKTTERGERGERGGEGGEHGERGQ